jgi:hypothetical protein
VDDLLDLLHEKISCPAPGFYCTCLPSSIAQPFSLLKDINTADGNNTGGSAPRYMVEVNGVAFFIAYTPSSIYGTRLLHNLKSSIYLKVYLILGCGFS